MYCPNCRAVIADGAKFCPSCGSSVTPAQNNYFSAPQPVSPVPQPTPSVGYRETYEAQKNAIRQSEMNALHRALQHFSLKMDEYDTYDYVCDQVNRYARGAKSGLLVWGAIIFTFSLLVMLAASGILSAAEAPAELYVLAFIFLIPGAAMLAGGILMKVNNRRKYNYFLQEYDRLSAELYDHYRSYANCPVGPEYSNPHILASIMQVLQSGRADTVKDSINLMIADSNYRAMNQYLDQIQRSTAAINAQTRAAAIFMAARFFM